jgi:hypothetical protein
MSEYVTFILARIIEHYKQTTESEKLYTTTDTETLVFG